MALNEREIMARKLKLKPMTEERFARIVADSRQPMLMMPMWPNILMFLFLLTCVSGIGCLLGAYSLMDANVIIPLIGNPNYYLIEVYANTSLMNMLAAGGSLTILGCAAGCALTLFLALWAGRAAICPHKTAKSAHQSKMAVFFALIVVLSVTLMLIEGVTRSNVYIQGNPTSGMQCLGQYTYNPVIGENYKLYLGFGLALVLIGWFAAFTGIKKTARSTVVKSM